MEELKRQVSRAHRRLLLQRFLSVLPGALCATLLLAMIALGIPKLWPLPVDGSVWMIAWIAGALVVGLLSAVVWTVVQNRGRMDAAIELDRRFGLKERVSSTMALSDQDRQSEVGQALVDDTLRRVTRIDVSDRFGFTFGWRPLLPFAPAALIFLLVVLVDDAQREDARAAARSIAQQRQQIKTTTVALKKKIEQKKKEAEAKGLEDAEALLKQLEQGLDKMQSEKTADRQKALIKMNDLAKELEKRRQQLGGSEQMRKQLDRLKNLQQGPADRVTSALKQGDFKKAMDEVQRLQEKLEKGELTEQEREQLAQQLEEMQKKLDEMVAAHQQAKQELEERIKELEKAGDKAAAGRLQEKLNQLNQQNQQMERLQQMASQMGQCSQCLREGDAKQAASQLGQVASQLQELQEQLDELETINDVMDQIADAKNAMNCAECDGAGCMACQGFGMGNYSEGPPGFGMGEGQGQGERPEERTDTSYYESKVAAKPQPGEAIRVGDADGPNIAGSSQQEIKEQIESALSRRSDPLTDQRLPRDQREHAKQYFDRFQQDR